MNAFGFYAFVRCNTGLASTTITANGSSYTPVVIATDNCAANNPVCPTYITAGTIDNAAIGGTTPAAGTFTSVKDTGLLSAPCVGTNSSGTLVSGTCSSSVSSVTAANSSLTISPTTGSVTAYLNTANSNAWTAPQTVELVGSGPTAIALSVQTTTLATSSLGSNGPCVAMTGSYWNVSGPNIDVWCAYDAVGNGNNPATSLTFAHTGSTGTATVVMPNISVPGSYIGPSTAPSGSCAANGAWVFSQDGHATFCASGIWTTKI
jgi:hypothetical protein